jgi:hypothetical protein
VIIADGSCAGQVVIIADVSYANGSSPPDRITTGFELAVKNLVITFQFHKGRRKLVLKRGYELTAMKLLQ